MDVFLVADFQVADADRHPAAAARLDGRSIDDIVDAGIGDGRSARGGGGSILGRRADAFERGGQRGAVDFQRQNAGDGQRPGELPRRRAQRFVCGHGDDARVGYRRAPANLPDDRKTIDAGQRQIKNDEGRCAAAGGLL
jgi:hypothetical protein